MFGVMLKKHSLLVLTSQHGSMDDTAGVVKVSHLVMLIHTHRHQCASPLHAQHSDAPLHGPPLKR